MKKFSGFIQKEKENIDEELERQIEKYKGEKTLKKGQKKLDYIHHITGIRTNPTGEEIEKKRTDYLESLNK